VPYLEVGFNQYREPSQGDDGEWYINYNSGCNDYNTDVVNIDGVWAFAKIVGFLSLVLGGKLKCESTLKCCILSNWNIPLSNAVTVSNRWWGIVSVVPILLSVQQNYMEMGWV
jgi:hypothetical protein